MLLYCSHAFFLLDVAIFAGMAANLSSYLPTSDEGTQFELLPYNVDMYIGEPPPYTNGANDVDADANAKPKHTHNDRDNNNNNSLIAIVLSADLVLYDGGAKL